MNEPELFDEDPTPLLQLASAPEAVDQALRLLQASAPAPMSRARHHALFQGAHARAQARQRVPRLALAFAAACLLGGLLSIAVLRWARPPEFVPDEGSQLVLEGRTLNLQSGAVRVQPRRWLTVRVGGVEVSLQHARATVVAAADGVAISVEEGEAVIREQGQVIRLSAPQVFHSQLPTKPREALETLTLPPAHTAGCATGATGCLSTLAEGDGLEAETALYELGLQAYERGDTAEAIARFGEHQRRFGTGVLAPEASIGLMLGHLKARDAQAAASEARRFLARFSGDARAGAVRALAR